MNTLAVMGWSHSMPTTQISEMSAPALGEKSHSDSMRSAESSVGLLV